jgi:hypothetical protein
MIKKADSRFPTACSSPHLPTKSPDYLEHYRTPAPTFLAKRVLPLALLALSQGFLPSSHPPQARSFSKFLQFRSR